VPVAVSRALGRDVTHYQIAYLDYDWSLNIVPGKPTGGK